MFAELNQISLGRSQTPWKQGLKCLSQPLARTCQKFQNCLTPFLPSPLGYCALPLAKLRRWIVPQSGFSEADPKAKRQRQIQKQLVNQHRLNTGKTVFKSRKWMDMRVDVSDSVSGLLSLNVMIETTAYMQGLLCAQHTASFICFTDETVGFLKHSSCVSKGTQLGSVRSKISSQTLAGEPAVSHPSTV